MVVSPKILQVLPKDGNGIVGVDLEDGKQTRNNGQKFFAVCLLIVNEDRVTNFVLLTAI